jgi:hypothetical protein
MGEMDCAPPLAVNAGMDTRLKRVPAAVFVAMASADYVVQK